MDASVSNKSQTYMVQFQKMVQTTPTSTTGLDRDGNRDGSTRAVEPESYAPKATTVSRPTATMGNNINVMA